MSNLTKAKNLVFETPEWHGRPGYILVVYRKRNGLELREVLPEGQGFRPSLLDRMSDLVVFAVNNREDLRYALQRPCTHMDGLVYVLHCTLTFRIDMPEKLVNHIEEDPLQFLEDEAARLFTATTRSMPWQFVDEESIEFKLATNYTQEDHDHVIRTNLEILQNCASRFGIYLANAVLSRSLPPDASRVRIAEAWADGRVDDVKIRIQGKHRLTEEEMQAGARVARDDLASSGDFADFMKRAGKLEEVSRQNGTLFLGAASPRVSPTNAGPSTNGTFLPPQNYPSTAGLASLLEQVLTVLNAISLDNSERRALGSGLLHLVAEAFQGDEADVDILDRYAALADQASQDLMDRDRLGSEPRRLIHSLLKTDTLVRQLS